MKGFAFCPAHVTGFFKAEMDNKRHRVSSTKGSLGAGFSIQTGVKTAVVIKPTNETKSNFRIKISGYRPDNTQVSETVIDEFLKLVSPRNYFIDVYHEIGVPVGYGLGCSGAVALSLSFALNKALNTGLSKIQVGQIAHSAEVSCQTGLGDVLASYHGGFEIRTKAGAPGIGLVEKIDAESYAVLMICFSPISTKKFINEKLSYINGLGEKMVNKLVMTKNLSEFQDMSIEFARYIKVMTPKMEKVVKDLHKNGIKCGVALFGETVFTLIPSGMEQIAIKILTKYNDGIIIKSKIDNAGARLAEY